MVAGSYFASMVATGFGRIIRGRVFDRVAHFSVHQVEEFSTAALITRTTNDTTQVQQVLLMLLSMAIGGVTLSLYQQMLIKIDRLNLVLDEGLSGVPVIRAFDRGADQSRRFATANEAVTKQRHPRQPPGRAAASNSRT